MMFKEGDIVECVKDRPCGARIKKGDLAIILSTDIDGSVYFDNFPKQGYEWAAWSKDFILHVIDLENK